MTEAETREAMKRHVQFGDPIGRLRREFEESTDLSVMIATVVAGQTLARRREPVAVAELFRDIADMIERGEQ